MTLDRFKHIFFLGAGGIGMSALIRYCLEKGLKVSGYDKTPTNLTYQLSQEGAAIFFEDNPDQLSELPDLVVYTPAVPASSQLFQSFSAENISMIKRAMMLGLICKGKPTIAIAGTHGKTTITSMVAHIFKCAGMQFTAFLGGISTNYGTNYLKTGSGDDWMIVEADEFDRSFLQLEPHIALISSIDADHLDIYGTEAALLESFSDFTQKIISGGTLVMKSGLQIPKRTDIEHFSYHLERQADFCGLRLAAGPEGYTVQLKGLINSDSFSLGLPGQHNLENAVGAASVASCAGISHIAIAQALATFKGVKRRFEKCFQGSKWVYYDDYAHHPEEIKATIIAIQEMYPKMPVTAIFQPHLYSRTRDLAKGFAESLALADKVLLLEIYPARELPIAGISSQWLLDQISHSDKQLISPEYIVQVLNDTLPGVLLTMGAGDIDRLVPQIVSHLKKLD